MLIDEQAQEQQQAAAARKAFEKHDKDGSGAISIDELQDLADFMGLPLDPDELEQVHTMLDKDGSGVLEVDEWVNFWVARTRGNPDPQKQQEVVARHAFAAADENGSGYIDIGELEALCLDLGLPLESAELQEAMTLLDKDGNGMLCCDEFVQWWVPRTAETPSGLAQKLQKVAAAGKRLMHTDVHTAAWVGDLPLVKQFLTVDTQLASAPDNTEYGSGMRPLHYAAYQGHQHVCEVLVAAGAKVNALTEDGCSALFFAVQQGHTDVALWLLAEGADLTHCEKSTGYTVLDVARLLYPDLLEQLLTKCNSKFGPAPTPRAPPCVAHIGETTLKVEFQPLADCRDQLPIRRYTLKAVPVAPPDATADPAGVSTPPHADVVVAQVQAHGAPDTIRTTIQGLATSTSYVVMVAAVNSMGESAFSEPSEAVQTLDEGATARPPLEHLSEAAAVQAAGRERAEAARLKRAARQEQQQQQQQQLMLLLTQQARSRRSSAAADSVQPHGATPPADDDGATSQSAELAPQPPAAAAQEVPPSETKRQRAAVREAPETPHPPAAADAGGDGKPGRRRPRTAPAVQPTQSSSPPGDESPPPPRSLRQAAAAMRAAKAVAARRQSGASRQPAWEGDDQQTAAAHRRGAATAATAAPAPSAEGRRGGAGRTAAGAAPAAVQGRSPVQPRELPRAATPPQPSPPPPTRTKPRGSIAKASPSAGRAQGRTGPPVPVLRNVPSTASMQQATPQPQQGGRRGAGGARLPLSARPSGRSKGSSRRTATSRSANSDQSMTESSGEDW